MKIVIAGMGGIGAQLAKQLSAEEHDIVAIDRDEKALDYVEALSDLLVLEGDAASGETLARAGVADADLFLAVTNSQPVNVTASIFAKRLGAKRTLARVSDEEFVSNECELDLVSLGVDHLIYPEGLTALETVKLIRRTAATDVVEFEDGKLALSGVRLDPAAPIVGKTIEEAAAEFGGERFRIVAAHRGFETFVPGGGFRFAKNDQIFVFTASEGIDATTKLAGGSPKKFDDVMILGGGKVGGLVARMLEDELNVKLIESNLKRGERLAERLSKTLVIQGDGRDIDLLAQEGIVDMDAFVAVTEDSETNIITCLMAKHLNVKKAVALVDNVDYIPLTQTIGLDALINKKLIAANNIRRWVRKKEYVSSSKIYGIDAEVIEYECQANAPITKGTLRDVKFPKDAIVGGLIRDGAGEVATGSTHVREGDRVVVFALPNAVQKAAKFFR
jgi:trk system potassium uptake protein TrkA